jgi:predicted PurR-regulated permease PerM
MKKLTADFRLKILVIAAAAFVVINFGVTQGFITKLGNVFQPVIIGVVLAVALACPMEFFDKKLFAKIKRDKLRSFLALALTLVIFAGVITVLAVLVVPQCVKSVKEILESINSGETQSKLNEIKIFAALGDNFRKAYDYFISKISEYLPKIINVVQNVFVCVYNILFGTVIAVMLLCNRENVKIQLKKAIFLIFKGKNLKVHKFLQSALAKFSKYLGGQLVEACILGAACYLTMFCLKVPYTALVSLIIGFVNLIPILGAYIGGAVCAIIIFAVSPQKALVFIIAVIILQQMESFTTYPVIVGKYVGLNGFWITVSIIIWGGIFGFWGMFLGVPLSAFLSDLFENFYSKKAAESKLTTDSDKIT